MTPLYVGSLFFQALAAYLSVRFVLLKRLGRPWLLVSLALGLMVCLSLGRIFFSTADFSISTPGISDSMVELLISVLIASGFALTDRWFALKERLEGRFGLIAEADRSLVGLLDEGKIRSAVCAVLSGNREYPLVWIGIGEQDGSIRVAESAGDLPNRLTEIPLRWDDSPDGHCPPGIALRTGACAVNRTHAEVGSEPWRAFSAKHGFPSCASVRVECEGHAPMALTVHARNESAFDRLEMEAITALARRVGVALQSARRHEHLSCAKQGYDDLLKTQRDSVLLVRGERIVRVNPTAIAMLGYTDGKGLLGEIPEIILPADADPKVRELFRGDLTGDPRNAIEMEVCRKDGSTFPGEVAVTWVPRPHRKDSWSPSYSGPLGMILIRDISARKRVMEELRRERDFSAKILDIAGVIVVQLDPDGRIILLNRHCEEMTGCSSADMIGRDMAEFLIPEIERDSYRRALSDILTEQVPLDLEYPLISRAGEERLVVWTHAILRDGGGRPVSVIATGTDVTERRRMEQQIIEMQKMEAVGTLAGGVAHDFNNILTGILGNLDLAQKSIRKDSPAGHAVAESIKSSERAAQLIRQLLDFSRRSPSERKAMDVGKVVSEVVHLFSQTMDKRIEAGASLSENLWPALADSNQIHQVLMNLCVNARDAIMECLEGRKDEARPPEGYKIHIRASNVTVGEEYRRIYPYARTGDYILLSISDNGAGMDEATQRRVFEPFFTTKKLGRGTGLGLSTVYGIVKQHDGWINLDSQQGKGTTFRVYFPRATDFAEREQPQGPEPSRPKRGRETVLLVDDEEMIRNVGRQILEIHGYTVLVAVDGQQAIDLFVEEQDRIDLVILDLTMPRLSGLEVLSRIRKVSPEAKVILSSGYLSGEVVHSHEAAGVAAFLQKPYRATVLARTVRDVLDGANIYDP